MTLKFSETLLMLSGRINYQLLITHVAFYNCKLAFKLFFSCHMQLMHMHYLNAAVTIVSFA